MVYMKNKESNAKAKSYLLPNISNKNNQEL